MLFRYQKIHQQLSEYVRTVLIVENAAGSEKAELPLFTNGQAALLCKTERTPAGIEKIQQLSLFGKSLPPDFWKLGKNETAIVYLFKPFSLACLFNISARELMKKPLSLSEWNAQKVHALKTQLTFAATTLQKTAALDHLLLHQLQQQQKECELIRHVTDKIMLNPGKEILTEVLDELKLNERTLQRLFKKYTGVTPGQFRRICQFKISFEQVRSGQYDHLGQVAFDSGFADQSHFIRSFKEFTKTTPKDYTKSGLKGK